MAKENKKKSLAPEDVGLPVESGPESAAPPEAAAPQESSRDRWRRGFAERHPDVDMDDEEAYYGALNDAYDEQSSRLKGYEEDDGKLARLLDDNPALSEVLLEMTRSDGKPFQALARVIGPNFAELLKDPENEELARQVADGQDEYAERVRQNRELVERARENLDKTIEDFNAVCDELGLTDDQATRLYELFDKIQMDALEDKIDKATWELLAKGVTHDDDVDAARGEGVVEGRNQKIKAKMRRAGGAPQPEMMQGQGGEGGETPDVPGYLGKVGSLKSVWDQ